MIGPAELEDILLDMQAAALEAGTSLDVEVFHPSFPALAEPSAKPQIAEEPAGDTPLQAVVYRAAPITPRARSLISDSDGIPGPSAM